MAKVAGWAMLGIALVLVAGCGAGGEIGAGGVQQATTSATSTPTATHRTSAPNTSSAGGCRAADVVACLMSRPAGATAPVAGNWAKDGAMSETDYINEFAVGADQQAQERDVLNTCGFVAASHLAWQAGPQMATEIALAEFGSTAGAARWLDVDNESYTEDKPLTGSPVPGVSMFAIETPVQGTYTYTGFGRFGSVVMEVYVFSHQGDDPVAEHALASAAATQSGILARATS